MITQTYTRPRRAAVSPAAIGPVTRAIRGLRPNEMPSWEIREAEMRRQEAADLLALRRRVAKAVAQGIDFLDATEADCDAEAEYHTTERAPDGSLYTQGRTSDDEPSLCGIGGHVAFGPNSDGTDRKYRQEGSKKCADSSPRDRWQCLRMSSEGLPRSANAKVRPQLIRRPWKVIVHRNLERTADLLESIDPARPCYSRALEARADRRSIFWGLSLRQSCDS